MKSRPRTVFGSVLAMMGLANGCSMGERVFVETLGTDTMAIEVFRRSADRFEGQRLTRNPVTQLITYSGEFTPARTIARMTVDWSTPDENPGGPAPYGYTVTLNNDTATIERRGGNNPGVEVIAVPSGTIPTMAGVPLSMLVFEQAALQWAASGQDSISVNLLNPLRGSMSANYVARWSGDSIAMSQFGSPLLGAVNDDGLVDGRTGERTTLKLVDLPGTKADIPALAADFAARDARGEGIGQASPPGSAQVSIGEARLSVEYSRPRKRGREIFGSLIPFNEIWRTGANAATMFRTNRDLRIGETLVPAGEYTLWSTYTPDGGTLIINSQTGQWGTAYDAAQDHARVPMTAESVDPPVEVFTISIEETAGESGGVIQLSWDRTRYSVGFQIQ